MRAESRLILWLLAFIALPPLPCCYSFSTIAQSRIRLHSFSAGRSLSSTRWSNDGDDDVDDDDDEGDRPAERQQQQQQRRLQDNNIPTTSPRKKSGRFAQSAHVAGSSKLPPTTTSSSARASSSAPLASDTRSNNSNNNKPRSNKVNDARDKQPPFSSRSRDSNPPLSRSRDDNPRNNNVGSNVKRQSSKPIVSSLSSKSSRPESPKFSASSSTPPPPTSSDFMWKSGKSIDDLENILKQRWGTRADRWTADPQDYEDADDDNDSDTSQANRKNSNPSTAAFRRSKPVLDPWQPAPPPRQRQAQVFDYDDDDDNEDDDDDALEEMDDDEDIDDDDDDDDDEEYYEEDDEGYEPSKRTNADWDLNHMIQPKPAGGKGSKALMTKSNKATTPSIPKPFFLPRQEPPSVIESKQRDDNNNNNNNGKRNGKQQQQQQDEDEEEEEVSKPKSRPKPTIPDMDPVLDDGGSPIFLTLEQAEREFAAISSATTGGDSNDNIDVTIDTPPESTTVSSPSTFSWQELGITSQVLLDNLNSMGCPTPLPVQQKSCPPILLGGKDVVVGTYTGSGKTLAVLVPLVQRLLWQEEQSLLPQVQDEDDDDDEGDDESDEEDDEEEAPSVSIGFDEGYTIDDSEGYTIDDSDSPPTATTKNTRAAVPMMVSKKRTGSNSGVQVLVVVPGRELASQMVTVARSLVEGTHLVPMLAIGGTTLARNWENMRKRKPNIIIGTPGRLAELILGPPGERSGKLKVAALQSVVLDEFDALLDYKAHRDPTQGLLEFLKKRHHEALQCVFCSATAGDMLNSPKVKNFLRPGFVQAMTDRDDVLVTPQTTSTGATRTSRTIIHGVVHVPHRRFALETLRKILHTDPMPQQILIFAENARRVDIVVEKLEEMGIVAAPLHGGMGSEKVDRAEVSKALREGYVGIVVATELAARGLDAPLLTHVINLELPTDTSHYAHRAGRCGRGGRPGVVINLTTNAQERNVPHRFAEELGVVMHTVEPRNGKLNIIHAPTPSQPVTI